MEHGKLLFGGSYDQSRLFIEPTLLEDISFEASLMEEEIFGPILPIVSYKDITEAIAFVNSKPKALALYIF